MDILLTKVLSLAIYPVGIVLILGLIAFALSYTSWRRAGRRILLAAIAVLWIASAPAFADWAIGTLESPYRAASIDDLPDADVAVLLGGLFSGTPSPTGSADASDAVDRALHAARIYHAGNVAGILVSGGNLPWSSATRPEAEMIADLLVELGVPRSAIVLETGSRNTRENAVNSAALFASHGWNSALLVTSAWHMRRAVASFEAVGLVVLPAPADFRGGGGGRTVLDFLPDAEALARTTAAIKEWVGLLVYRIRGWA